MVHVGRRKGYTSTLWAAHRVIASAAIGRTLKRSEVVMHIDNDKKNNKPENLYVCESISEFRRRFLGVSMPWPNSSNLEQLKALANRLDWNKIARWKEIFLPRPFGTCSVTTKTRVSWGGRTRILITWRAQRRVRLMPTGIALFLSEDRFIELIAWSGCTSTASGPKALSITSTATLATTE
jgi:hypothetical protein